MLGPGGQLLADEAAFCEADAMQLLEAALQEQRLLGHQIAAGIRNPQRQAVSIIVLRGRSREAVGGDEIVHRRRGQHDACPELREPRVDHGGEFRLCWQKFASRAEDREDSQVLAQILDRHLRPQPIHAQPLDEGRQPSALTIKENGIALKVEDEVEQTAPLGCEEGGVERTALA